MSRGFKQHTAEMADLYRDGQTLEQIGQKFGCTREYVRQLLGVVGVSRADGGIAVTAARKREERHFTLNERSIARRGMPLKEFQALPTKAKRAFIQQKTNANTRGIEWKLTIAEWWDIWQKSGKWELRGRGEGYCMGRKGDAGAYEAGNVYICTIGQNFSDSYLWKPAHMRKQSASGRGPAGKQIEFNGQSLCAPEWARRYGMQAGTLQYRLSKGWPIEKALNEPIKPTYKHRRRLQSEQHA